MSRLHLPFFFSSSASYKARDYNHFAVDQSFSFFTSSLITFGWTSSRWSLNDSARKTENVSVTEVQFIVKIATDFELFLSWF